MRPHHRGARLSSHLVAVRDHWPDEGQFLFLLGFRCNQRLRRKRRHVHSLHRSEVTGRGQRPERAAGKLTSENQTHRVGVRPLRSVRHFQVQRRKLKDTNDVTHLHPSTPDFDRIKSYKKGVKIKRQKWHDTDLKRISVKIWGQNLFYFLRLKGWIWKI